jgi:hypothetical protein
MATQQCIKHRRRWRDLQIVLIIFLKNWFISNRNVDSDTKNF